MATNLSKIPFSTYQKVVIVILVFTRFSVMLDFMIMAPMGDVLMKSFLLKPSQFGIAVSAYAFSAGISGILTAGIADRFDRKGLLLFFYLGFIAGTFFCGLANSYTMLLMARIVTGFFGGVIGSVAMAIVTDLFEIHHRGRVIGYLQMGFGASQVLGVPLGLFLATHFSWRVPFDLIGIMSIVIASIIILKIAPINQHVALQRDKSAIRHLLRTFSKRSYLVAYLATAFLSIGGFMMMPFSSAFAVNNLKVSEQQLPLLFMCTGIFSLFAMPLAGRLSDRIDKFQFFTIMSAWLMIFVVFYANLAATPFWLVIAVNILIMAGVLSRMVPATAITTSILEIGDRGAYMSISSSIQQVAGGVAAVFAGIIVKQKDRLSPLEHYDTLAYVMVMVCLLSIMLLHAAKQIASEQMEEVAG